MKISKLAFAAALAMAATPAALSAQSTAVGTTIYGPQGSVVGTVVEDGEGVVVVDTGKHKATLPDNAFGEIEEGKTAIGMTKADLDAQIDKLLAENAAKMQAALVAGASVVDVDGKPLGTIKSVDGNSVVVAAEFGEFALQPENFALRDNKLTAAVRSADVAAQLGASTEG